MQIMIMNCNEMSKSEYLIVPKGMKFAGSGKLELNAGLHHSFMYKMKIEIKKHWKNQSSLYSLWIICMQVWRQGRLF